MISYNENTGLRPLYKLKIYIQRNIFQYKLMHRRVTHNFKLDFLNNYKKY